MVQPFFRRKKIFERRRKIFKRAENEKFKNRKNKKNQVFPYACVCACVKDENWVIFPVVDAVKRQEMPNLPLFSVSGGFKLENGIVIGCWQNKRSGGLKNGLFDFSVNFLAKNLLNSDKSRTFALWIGLE